MGYKVGDKSKAICSNCKKVVSTTFEKRLVDFLPRKHSEEKVLVGVCDSCGDIVSSIPPTTNKKSKK